MPKNERPWIPTHEYAAPLRYLNDPYIYVTYEPDPQGKVLHVRILGQYGLIKIRLFLSR